MGNGMVVTHSYSARGFFRVALTLTTSQGNPSASKTLKVWLPGDVNDDCAVNFVDLGRVGSSFMKTIGQTGYDPDADFADQGIVNFMDLGIVGANFFRICT